MFSPENKHFIAAAIEQILLSLKHPEMPTENPLFHLHVEGKESWSWADILPNRYAESTNGFGPSPLRPYVYLLAQVEALRRERHPDHSHCVTPCDSIRIQQENHSAYLFMKERAEIAEVDRDMYKEQSSDRLARAVAAERELADARAEIARGLKS